MSLEDELQQVAGQPKINDEQLGELGKQVKKLLKLRLEIADVENHLSGLKRDYNDLAIGKVPEIMAELGLDEVRTDTGAKITVNREVQCKFIPEVKEKALDWLETNDYGAIIKREVSVAFGKESESLARRVVEALRNVGVDREVTMNVHPMTLKAWA